MSSGRPAPYLSQWRYEGSVISNQATLVLRNIQRTQAGVYTCTKTNIIGTASADITITVQCEWEGGEGRGGRGRDRRVGGK